MSSGVAVRVWSPGTHACATCCRAGCLTHSVSVEGGVCGCEDVPLSSVCARFMPACLWKGGGKRSWICLRRAPWLHPSPPPSILMQSGGGEGKGGHNPAAVFRHQWDEWVLLPTDWREPDMPSGHGHIPSDAPSVDCLPGTVYPRASRKLQGCFHCVYETLWCVQCVSPELVCTCLRTLLVHRRGLLVLVRVLQFKACASTSTQVDRTQVLLWVTPSFAQFVVFGCGLSPLHRPHLTTSSHMVCPVSETQIPFSSTFFSCRKEPPISPFDLFLLCNP